MGVVTTTRVTHATPAALYAHTAHRQWETDFDLKNRVNSYTKYKHLQASQPEKCTDIAWQLMKDFPGKEFQVWTLNAF